MATIDSLDIQISASAEQANKAIRHLTRSLGALSSALKFDTSSLEKLGKINGNNFKKLGEGLQSFANAAKSLQGVNAKNFDKLADGLTKIGSVDPSKLDALGKIDGNALKNVGEGVKALSAGIKELKGVSKTDFNKLASGIERLGAIQPGNMQAVGNALRPLADGIKILSGTTFDNKNLQNLINSLTRLSNANVGNLANADFTSIGAKIKELAEVLSGADKVEQNTISMTNAIAKLAAAGANVSTAASGLPLLGEKLKEFMQTMSGAAKIGDDTIAFTQAVGNLASAGGRIKGVTDNLVPFGEQLKKFFEIMSTAPTVSDNVIRMVHALAEFAGAGGRANVSTNVLNRSIDSLSISMAGLKGSAAKAIKGLESFGKQVLSAMGVTIGIYGAIQGIKKSIEISSALTEVQNVVDVTFQDMAYKVEEFASTSIEQLGMSELSVKQYASRFQAMGVAMGINGSLISDSNSRLSEMTNGYVSASDSISDVSLNLTKLTADMASFYDVEQKAVAEDLAAIFTGQTVPLRQYGLDLTQATLQEWAHKQGMEANMRTMSQAEKTMLRYQYVMANTAAAHGDFARTADTWANQIRILKQNFEQLGKVMGGSFINFLKPLVQALNVAISHITAFAETVSNSLGKIFGWKFEKSSGAGGLGGLVGDASDLEDGIGGATDAAKKLKSVVLGIDELNIKAPDDGDKGGGSGGAGLGIGGMLGEGGGKWTKDETLMEYESELDTLYKLGEYIGNTLKNALGGIEWEDVYQSAKNFGSGLANFLNGLISPELFGALGTTIASSLNTALYALNSFGETFDWKDFGKSIATGVNNFFATFNFALLAETLNTWAGGILDTAISFIDETDWKKIGKQIGVFLSKIDFLEIGKKIGIAIWEAINAGIDLFKGMFEVAPIETTIIGAVASIGLLGSAMSLVGNIATGLQTFLSPLFTIFSGIGEVLSGTVIPFLTGLSAPVLAIVAAITALIAGLGITYATNEEVRESFSQAISSIKEGLQPAIEFLTNKLLPDLRSGWDRILEILSPLGEFLNGMFLSIWQDMINPALKYVGETVLPLVTEAFSNLWNNVLVPLGTLLADVLAPVIQVFSDLLTYLWQYVVVPLADAVMNVLGAQFELLCGIFSGYVIPVVSDIISDFQFLWNEVLSPIVDFLIDTFQPIFEDVFKKIKGIIEGLNKAFSGLIDFITGIFTGDWKKAWGGIKDIFKGVFDSLISIVEGTLNIIIDGINFFLRNFNSIVGGITGGVGGILGINVSVSEISKIELPRFAKGGITLSHTFAEIGELNKPEAILPLSDTRAMGMIADSIMDNADYNYNGNGGVLEGSQIEEAVRKGVRDAVAEILAPYLADIVQNTRESADKDMSVTLDSRELIDELDKKNQSLGFDFRTGNSRGRVVF